jgi:hypothetical protein
LYYHLKANPQVAEKLGWPIDLQFCAEKVDEFNATLCEANGWTEYITDQAGGGRPAGDPFPFPSVSQVSPLRKVAAGGAVLVEWISSGAEAVSGDVATARAGVCAQCDHNQPGGMLTAAVSEGLRKALNLRREWKLETPFDDRLRTCDVCLCPLRLKVHVPLDRILSKLDAETKAGLAPQCWITAEEKGIH